MRAISAPSSPDRAELFDELGGLGFDILPGQMGENVATSGVDLLGLATGTRLRLGEAAIVEVTGLRNPCAQLDRIKPGLMKATLDRDAEGNLVRKAGIMGIVVAGGEIRAGDVVRVDLPPLAHTLWPRSEDRWSALYGSPVPPPFTFHLAIPRFRIPKMPGKG